ncbi:ATPase AAA [Leptotrichia wadei]|uniref:ATPase AAA n=1 Tax=Leptotrichia wadei TaxID=157687 RepID=A0A510KBN9_9FUSO|nr:ATPase AAA [Leptotrichia wadei]
MDVIKKFKKREKYFHVVQNFRPEFLNRFNAVIEFSHLNKKDLSQIVDLMLIEVNKTLSKKKLI